MSDKDEYFDNRGKHIALWEHKARELYDAAHAVWNYKKIPNPNGDIITLSHPAQLLMGLSLECLIKGYIISIDSSAIENGRLRRDLQTHSLELLFKVKANITIKNNYEELDFLRRLSEVVHWMGKYPIPIKTSQLMNPIYSSNKRWVGSDYDLKRFNYLYQKVMEKLREQ